MSKISAFLYAAVISLIVCACENKEEINIPSLPDAINLSADEAYANCYMVNHEGSYFFETKHVDGSTIQGIVSADWIWSTNDIETDGLLSNVVYREGYIYFNAGQGHGNALIGAFDSNGKIVWSWHIWLTEPPSLQTLDNGAVFMDRNLGAMSAKPEDTSLTYGLKYQWGRKDPFYGGDSNEEKGCEFSEANEATVFNPNIDMKWATAKKNEKVGSIEFSISNPTTFIFEEQNADRDWLFKRNDYLWSDELTGAKTNYDPCPAGYRVAYDDAWEGCGYWNVDDDPINGGRIHITDDGEKFWWPLAGTRWGDSDAGKLGYVGLNGAGEIWIRSTTNCGSNASCFYYQQGTYMGSSYAMYRAHGGSVRCVKEQ